MTIDELKILAKNLDLTETEEVKNFLEIIEVQDFAKNLYLEGLKKIYLEKIKIIDEIDLYVNNPNAYLPIGLDFVKSQDFKINPIFRHSILRIYLTALAD